MLVLLYRISMDWIYLWCCCGSCLHVGSVIGIHVEVCPSHVRIFFKIEIFTARVVLHLKWTFSGIDDAIQLNPPKTPF
jgi:hypothetical protein